MKPEIDADSFALGRMGLADTWQMYRQPKPIELPKVDVDSLMANMPKINLPKPLKAHLPKKK